MTSLPPPIAPSRARMRAALHQDEAAVVAERLAEATLPPSQAAAVTALAGELVGQVRQRKQGIGGQLGLEAFLAEYSLSTREGVALMCLAEALLRIPDAATADRLIQDKIGSGDWDSHKGRSESIFVNASAWALSLTGRLLGPGDEGWPGVLARLAGRLGEPVVRSVAKQAMRHIAQQFVLGRNIDEALDRAAPSRDQGYRFSFDMLGEGALTTADAQRYFDSYAAAIRALGKAAAGGTRKSAGISVKLSALHPRYEFAQGQRVRHELVPRVIELARLAAKARIGMTIDSEEADRLEPSMDVLEALCNDPELAEWDGLGIAVQAYQRRARAHVDWLVDLARSHRRRLVVRLVKGAYWDSEIKRAQMAGLDTYPVFTRKASTDVSYLACARALLAARDVVSPAFATHNAQTVAAIMTLAGDHPDWEFQRLHGMGDELYAIVTGERGVPCRVYAPVGSHEDLLPYLVRRMLENGANSSFVHRIVDERVPVEALTADPVAQTQAAEPKAHPKIPLPRELYGAARVNSRGLDLADPQVSAPLLRDLEERWAQRLDLRSRGLSGPVREIASPIDRRWAVGSISEATAEDVARAASRARAAQPAWDARPAEQRAAILDAAAERMEAAMPELIALCVSEAGKSIHDGVLEVREAVDFLRYYAERARIDFAGPQVFPGPTGEHNDTRLSGRGVFACISPWNFPLAIFAGQVAAALAAGNGVLAKPAEQTPLIAARAVRLLHEAGVPEDLLHLLPGDGPTVGAAMVASPDIAGVCFTGSAEVARLIHRQLAERDGPILPLIAETGGQNAMIVDSSALPEQVVRDALASAFQSAGQRCSALRVLCLQEEIADRVVAMLKGAMGELVVGDPRHLSTDIGPVIDEDAHGRLAEHVVRISNLGRLIAATPVPDGLDRGVFFAPCAYQIDRLDLLTNEVFGPVLHVLRWKEDQLDQLIDAINATGYGLTLGIHSRIDTTIRHVLSRARVGNAYVNRNQIGAVVGVQPFGGEGLSGTGPKAGGPRYLHRFATERTVAINTAAAGGNAALMTME